MPEGIGYERNSQKEILYNDSSIATYVRGIFDDFRSSRMPYELEWEEDNYNFLGQYQQNTTWKKTEGLGGKSRVFIKLTALKCNTAQAKIVDVLFPRDEMPFGLDSTTFEHIYRQLGLNAEQVAELVAIAEKKLKMHYKDIDLQEVFSIAILDMAILGSAVLKGPIAQIKNLPYPTVKTFGGFPIDQLIPGINPVQTQMLKQVTAVIDHIPLWEYYCDPNAKSNSESIMEMQFQRLLPGVAMQLANQDGWVRDNVMASVERASLTHDDDHTDKMLGDNYQGSQGLKDKKVPFLEAFGMIPVKYLRDLQSGGFPIEVPKEMRDHESVEGLVVLGADNIVCKADINYSKRRPYYMCPYKKRPHCVYGVGVAGSIRDSQKMVNSAARMTIDNKALSGNGMFAINKSRIDVRKTGNLEFHSGKVVWTKANFSPNDAIQALTFPDVTAGLQELMELFLRFADEESGIPKITHGEQGDFLNKTARGMSMLMGAANIGLKPVMKNIDDYWIEPITEAFYDFFVAMQDPAFPVPLKVKATGHDNLMAKEIKIENLMNFMQLTSGPQDAIFTDRVKFIKMIARLMETEDVVKTEEEIQAILQTLADQSKAPGDLRERLNIEKLYPLLSRIEQAQILDQLGITPDPNYDHKTAELQAQLLLEGMKTQGKIAEKGTPAAVVPGSNGGDKK